MRFLSQTIDSLLAQTFTDFELLIINDGSTDETEQIIRSYNDHRIQYIKNDVNSGLIYTLNKGIELALGKYIARMDADDIALTERLAVQKQWLDEHPATAVVGCAVQFIDEHNKNTGVWPLDQKTITAGSILSAMVKENCLAHPTVMIRSNILKQFRYNKNQQHTEDYDLWLRLLANGFIIDKVPQNLLLYRVHQSSITGSILRKSNPFYKQFNCKRRFLAGRLKEGKWGAFESSVLLTTLYDGVMGTGKHFKNLVLH